MVRRIRLGALSQLAEEQLRVVSRKQLRDRGWTHDQVEHEIRFGRWSAPAPNVVSLQNAPLTHDQKLWLGVLHAGPPSVLTHGTACSVGGLTGWESEIIEVLAPKGDLVMDLDGFFFHQTRRPYIPWVQQNRTPPRLRLDVAALLAAERDRSLRRGIGRLAACVQQRLTTAERLLLSSYEISKLRHGKHFRLALGDIAGGAQSFAEIEVGRLCRAAGLVPPARQRIRRDMDGRKRYLDCEWDLPDGRVLVLEIDGSFHLRTDNWWRDMKRERGVVISGRTVLRCGSIEVRLEPDDIMRDLAAIGVPRMSRTAA